MPNTCAAPGCRTGYKPKKRRKTSLPDSEKDEEEAQENDDSETEKLSIFIFPSHEKEPERRKTWIAKVPRKDWKPRETDKIYLCEKHFMPTDIIIESTDTNNRRKRKKDSNTLTQKRLRENAIPCNWPNNPAHLSNPPTARPTSSASSDVRRENTERWAEQAEQERMAQDTYSSLEELVSKFDQVSLPSDVQKVVSTDYVLLHKLIFRENVPELQYSVQVHSDLSLTICHSKEKLKTSYIERNISRDSKTNTCSKLSEIIHHLENIEVIELSDQDVIDVIVEKLKDARFEGNNKVNFLAEQLNLLFKRPNARRYSPSMLAIWLLCCMVSPLHATNSCTMMVS